MPAWIYVLAVAAVLTVAWYGFARRWWHALRYSMRRASHAYAEVEDDYGSAPAFYGSAPLQGSMTLTEEIAYWNGDWRERTRVELAPEALDLLLNWATVPPDDPGPGGGVSDLSSSPPPGPDQDDLITAPGSVRLYWPLVPEVTIEPPRDPEGIHPPPAGPDWLECQRAEVYAWVRGMVPQVTGWSVGA